MLKFPGNAEYILHDTTAVIYDDTGALVNNDSSVIEHRI